MERSTILVGRLYKSVVPTKYFFKVPLVGRFVPLVGGIGRLVESPLISNTSKNQIVTYRIMFSTITNGLSI